MYNIRGLYIPFVYRQQIVKMITILRAPFVPQLLSAARAHRRPRAHRALKLRAGAAGPHGVAEALCRPARQRGRGLRIL